MKKLTGALATLVFTATLSSAAFAFPPTTIAPTPKGLHQEHFKQKNSQLKEFIKASIKKNNGDLQKVKADVDQYLNAQRLNHQMHLEKIANEKGMTVEELKKQFAQKRQIRLEEKAKKLNLTPAELKKQMQTRHDEKLKVMAQDLGLTLEQLKQILPSKINR